MIRPGDEIGDCSPGTASTPRRLAWVAEGIRWRCVAFVRKSKWAYRGIRWRITSVNRKIYWRYRRAARFVVGLLRRRVWAARRVYRRVGLSTRRLGAAISWIRNPSSLLKHQRLTKEVDYPLRLMAGANIAADDSDRIERRLRRRVARLTQRPLAPINTTSRLVAEIPVGTRWNRRDRARVSASRLVRVCGPLPARRDHELLVAIPALLSGRPVVDTELVGLPYLDLDEARILDENSRMRIAHHQLRELVTSSILREQPRIGVILSSNRPSLLPAAIAQLRAQRHVEVELRIGIHSKDRVPDLGGLSGGAISDVRWFTLSLPTYSETFSKNSRMREPASSSQNGMTMTAMAPSISSTSGSLRSSRAVIWWGEPPSMFTSKTKTPFFVVVGGPFTLTRDF